MVEEKVWSSGGLDQDTVVRSNRAGRHVLGWQEVRVEERKPPIAFQDHGVYLITGGLGGLGVLFAKEILEQTGQGRVVFTGRSALRAEKQTLFDGFSAPPRRGRYLPPGLCRIARVRPILAR